MLAAAVVQVDTPLDRLAALRALIEHAVAVERDAVEPARSGGASWSAVAGALAVSKQAAARYPGPSCRQAWILGI